MFKRVRPVSIYYSYIFLINFKVGFGGNYSMFKGYVQKYKCALQPLDQCNYLVILVFVVKRGNGREQATREGRDSKGVNVQKL
jgi:hypothetical protein